jgi:hypothetical protein
MSDEKRIDLKYFIQPEVRDWYRGQLESFYLVITDFGEILHFSEDSLDFFKIEDATTMDDYSISSYIGDKNWDHLLEKLVSTAEQTSWLPLPDRSVITLPLGVKWRSFTEHGDSLCYLLLFSRFDEKPDAGLYFPEILEHIQVPTAVIVDESITWKNQAFEILAINCNLGTLSTIKEWVSDSTAAALFLEQREQEFSIQVTRDDHDYVVSGKWFDQVSGAWTLSILRRELDQQQQPESKLVMSRDESLEKRVEATGLTLEPVTDQDIESIGEEVAALMNTAETADNSSGSLTDCDREELLEQVRTVRVKTESVMEVLLALVMEDTSDSVEVVNRKFNEYRTIIKNTSENLLKMSEIAQFIEDISARIHLISINAAIESARTGEAGKGFAVIAREIRKLSDATNNYTKMIGTEIENVRIYTENIAVTETDNNLQEVMTTSSNYKEQVQSMLSSIRDNVIESLDGILQWAQKPVQ